MTQPPLPPVQHRVRVTLAPAQAFALFTDGLARWWPMAGHSCYGDRAAEVRFEPRVGGAVTEIARDGQRALWGEITEWSPPEAFAMRWFPGLASTDATLLRVRFEALPAGGTEISVQHSGWESRGDLAADKRGQYERGWPHVLDAFLQHADSLGEPR
jgi:uncharacterized protein YndB with AHSA1/START domain